MEGDWFQLMVSLIRASHAVLGSAVGLARAETRVAVVVPFGRPCNAVKTGGRIGRAVT